MIRAIIRLGFLGLILAGLRSDPLYADLTTGQTLSLEWLVDSSDAIYLIRLRKPPPPDTHFLIERERVLKIPTDAEAVEQSHRTIEQWEIPRASQTVRDGDQWLVFIRTWQEKQPTIARIINLTRPLQQSATAAISSKGVPIPDRTRIVRAAEERVRLNRRLVGRARQVREQVDKGGGSDPFGDPARLEGYLGGFPIRINCDLWDNPPQGDHSYRIHGEDLLLTEAVVPADPEYREQLLEAARVEHGHERTRAICALVNYPGEATERFLKDLASPSPGWTFGPGWNDAKNVLWYFHFRHDLSDPLNAELVGRWRLVGQREVIDLTLEKGNTFAAAGFERPEQKGDEAPHLGR